MRFKILSFAIVSAALLPFAASANEGLSYTFVEAGYLNTDLDEASETVGGWALRGSVEFMENIFAYGRYTDQKTDIAGGQEIKLQAWDIGAGYAWPLAEMTDIYGTVGYANIDLDLPGSFGNQNTSDDGYTLGAGIRTRFAESFEVEGTARYQNLSDYGDEFDFGVFGRWYVLEQLALGVGYNAGDETSTFSGSVRWEF